MSDPALTEEPFTEAQLRDAAAAATRLLQDPYLREALDEMALAATRDAIAHHDPVSREASRNLVLAIGQLRTNLTAVLEAWRDGKRRASREKQWE